MELKGYQRTVISDLEEFLTQLDITNNISNAYYNYWDKKGLIINPLDDCYIKPYNNSIKNVPRVTAKVPTAGGKTFIACNALKTIFDSFPIEKPKVVVWFVPSDTILKQTYLNLNNPDHPYRQKIDSHFGSRVKVYLKQDLLQGASFSPTEVNEQLSIFVLSVQSFSANNKDSRKAYQENENLAQFPDTYTQIEKLLPDIDETALMQVIIQLNPVIIIDESHNFVADLRVDMLNSINPSFIYELTATPRQNSNIISIVDASFLKKDNMVKLPVIVYNHPSTDEVINSAIQLQKQLEEKAKIQEASGGKYIRPIVLFQAQPKNDDDNITFDKIKQHLLEIGIPEEFVKIKTANKDEIKNIDLMSKDCQVRYIITVNALKEGWDCPFAYILASLANRSSAVDVEQILGRVLRLPYVTKHKETYLNVSYVLTSSTNFLNTLDKIVIGLNKSGFSSKDYRVKEEQIEIKTDNDALEDLFNQSVSKEPHTTEDDLEIDTQNILKITESEDRDKHINDILETAIIANEEMETKIANTDFEDNILPQEIKDKMKSYGIKEVFKDEAKQIALPQFYMKVQTGSVFEEKDSNIALTKNMLLQGFDLSKEDHNIDFSMSSSQMYQIDLEESNKDEFVPKYKKVPDRVKEQFVSYIVTVPPENRINQIALMIKDFIKNIDEIPDNHIVEYVKNALKGVDSEKIADIADNIYYYSLVVKDKINNLIVLYTEKQFIKLLDKGAIFCVNTFKFPQKISPKNIYQGITKNLYTEEGEMNDFEKNVINKVANLDSVLFWHRNLDRGHGFQINGFINHYPDFIVKMKNGKIVLIETKGDHLDNSESTRKIKLGEKWASKAGDNYRYFMVFDNAKLDGSKTIPELIDILRDMK